MFLHGGDGGRTDIGRADLLAMSAGPTSDETTLFDEVSALAERVWNQSKGISATIENPKSIAVALFRRLRANNRAYGVLWKNSCYGGGEIIVRAAVETAICIAANSKMGDEFPRLVRRDAAATLQWQIKLYRETGDTEMVQSSEAYLRFLQAGFAVGEKAIKLDWKSLADAGGQPLLYHFYKMLSGMSSHVTGISLIREIGDSETEEMQAVMQGLSKRNYFNMMAATTLNGSLMQAGMIDDAACTEHALLLVTRMDELSMNWPRADG